MKEQQHQTCISIIIPVYNAEKYLYKCLESVEKQSYQCFEVLLVNDGSTDKSQTIMEVYANKYPEKYRIFTKTNGGQSSARNLALAQVKGEYITFLDSDDYYDTMYLETLINAAIENFSDMVISGQKKVDENGKIYLNIVYQVDKYPNTIQRRLNFSGKIYKTDYIQEHHMKFAEGKTYEDNPFNFIMIFLAKNLVILSYSGYNQVGHPGSTTTKKILEEKIPYKEIENAISYIIEHKEQINDYSIFEFTVLSFFTYFIFQANKKHVFLSLEERKSDQKVICNICTFVEKILDKYFPQYWKNVHIGILKNRDLLLTQRAGVVFFATLCRFKLLKAVAKIYYKF